MIEEWKSYTRYTKTVLIIYAILSLPLLPLMAVMVPLAWWVTKPEGSAHKMTLVDFLAMSVTMSLAAYGLFALLRCAK